MEWASLEEDTEGRVDGDVLPEPPELDPATDAVFRFYVDTLRPATPADEPVRPRDALELYELFFGPPPDPAWLVEQILTMDAELSRDLSARRESERSAAEERGRAPTPPRRRG